MEKIACQPDPVAWPAIVHAFETAGGLPVWKREPTRVGVCARSGDLVARGLLTDARQVRLFAIHMEAMDYIQLVLGEEDAKAHSCDVLFLPQVWGHAGGRDPALTASAA